MIFIEKRVVEEDQVAAPLPTPIINDDSLNRAFKMSIRRLFEALWYIGTQYKEARPRTPKKDVGRGLFLNDFLIPLINNISELCVQNVIRRLFEARW